MLKFKLFYDKDAEEDWLREMSLNGWALKKFFLGVYTFEPSEPGEYNYQIDILDNWNGDKADYEAFMKDTGVEVISQWWRWVYLQKKAEDGPFELYTDPQSKIAHYTKIMRFFQIVLGIEIVCFLIDFMTAITTGSVTVGILTGVIAVIALAILKVVWKCKWKIEQLQHEVE